MEITNNETLLCGRFQCQLERNKTEISLNSHWLKYSNLVCNGVKNCDNTDLDEVIDCDVECCDDDCDDEGKCEGIFCSKTEEGAVNPNYYVGPEKLCDSVKDCDDSDDEMNCGIINGTEDDEMSSDRSQAPCKQDKISTLKAYRGCLEENKQVKKNNISCCDTLIRSQSNCTEEEDVGVVCEVNGYSTSISKYMICSSLSKECDICDDDIENKCFQSLTCSVHKHFLCDGYQDCDDKSDEANSICLYKTRETCERRVGYMSAPIPLAWLNDGVKDCTDGSDEDDIKKWYSCGTGRTWRFQAGDKSCENVYICQSGEPGFVELSQLCDGIETCGNENEVCSAAQNKHELETKVSTFNEGLTKKFSFCMYGLHELQRHDLHCTIDNFIFPDHEFYGVVSKTKLILSEHSQNCDHMYGEQYVYTSCTGKCTNSVCPLKTIPRYEVCPSQFPKRVGTLGNNKYLAFFTVSRGNTYTNRYFVCKDTQKCLDYSQVCDLVKDCDDGSDEEYCSNHFECESSDSYIPKTSVCDGMFDCKDFSDECNEKCSKHILQGDILKVFSWLIGVLATLANVIILIRHAVGLIRSKNAVVLVNKSLMILICLGDFLTGSYLITISVYDSIIGTEYCRKQLEWITSTECSIIGVFSTIGSQISLFSMTGLSIVRIYVIWATRSRNTSSRINLTNIVLIVGLGLLIVLASVAIAVIPIMPQLEDFFVNGINFNEELKIFIGMSKKETVVQTLEAYYGRISKKIDLSWNLVLEMVLGMFSHDYRYEDYTTEVKKVHFYGNDGVCLFKYFVDKDDPQKVYVWSILAINFSCFLFISVSYLLIYLITSQSSNATGNQNESRRMNSMNRKIAFIIMTDFCCWIPFLVVCCLHSFEVVDATPWYGLFSMIILPINSMINPFLYDDFMIRSVRKKLRDLFDFLTSFSTFLVNRNSAHEASVQAGEIEMQQVENQAE